MTLLGESTCLSVFSIICYVLCCYFFNSSRRFGVLVLLKVFFLFASNNILLLWHLICVLKWEPFFWSCSRGSWEKKKLQCHIYSIFLYINPVLQWNNRDKIALQHREENFSNLTTNKIPASVSFSHWSLIALLTATAAWKLVPQPIMMRRLQRLTSFRWSFNPPRTTEERRCQSQTEQRASMRRWEWLTL